MSRAEMIVIGGGLVGAALSYGLQSAGVATLMLDEGDRAFRAARGNFGLVWVQSKGLDCPPYAAWTRRSADGWPDFAEALGRQTGRGLDYARPGGIEICLSTEEMAVKTARMDRLATQSPDLDYRMLDRRALGNLLPGLGAEVVGGCLCPADGHVNPLALLTALHEGFQARGGRLENAGPVTAIEPRAGGFMLRTAAARHECERLVIAAGLGSPALARMVGLEVPLRPQRGQNIVTERLRPFLPMPLSRMRQTAEGSVQIGETKEEVGHDDGTTVAGVAGMAARALRIFPHLARARMVRAWGALRVMTPDGAPIYAQSPDWPGAYAAVCHSGVTLAAAHANTLAPAIAAGTLPEALAPLGPERFAHG